jgi:molecular chaperone DnaK
MSKLATQAVGIDLGTTYSCISYLNEHGEPVTIANDEGELSTPSVVLFDTDETVVGTEALRNAVVKPSRVIQNSKRYIGSGKKAYDIDGQVYTPVDIAALVLRKMLDSAENQIGSIDQAVITVPAQFSDLQRQATVEAGLQAGLKRVDIINEPVAAALCYVLGTEGLWFTELADEQRIMVYDLGGGTFDLSLVKYHKNEVTVIASSGDLHLGGIDWNRILLDAIAKQFKKEFGVDPRTDPESLQFLALEVENTKRSLTVRPKAALTCQHDGHRKSYQVEQTQFERLTSKLVEKTCDITKNMLKDNKIGWANVDVILTVGGASRMPMVRNGMKKLGGRTLNTSLSPDQSIAHGATYYAGMLLTNSDFAKSILNEEATARLSSIKQQSVNARGLGILVRDAQDNRIPHFLMPANTPLPASVKQTFGTVIPNQRRVHLKIVESGTVADQQYVELGTCVIEDLPPNLPENSEIEVKISYDTQARVHVSAKDVTSGKKATTELVREGSVVQKDVKQSKSTAKTKTKTASSEETGWKREGMSSPKPSSKPKAKKPKPTKPSPLPEANPAISAEFDLEGMLQSLPNDDQPSALDTASIPVPLCNKCGDPLDHRGECQTCGPSKKKQPAQRTKPKASGEKARPKTGSKPAARKAKPKPRPTAGPAIPSDDEILELEFADSNKPKPKPKAKAGPAPKPAPRPAAKPKATAKTKAKAKPKSKSKSPSVKPPPLPPGLSQDSGEIRKGEVIEEGEDEFWKLSD